MSFPGQEVEMSLGKPPMILKFGGEAENHSGSDKGVCIMASDANDLH